MDAIDNFIQSQEFLSLADSYLYEAAINKVEGYFSRLETIPSNLARPAKRNQVKGLQLSSRTSTLFDLKKMASNQLGKAIKRLKDPKNDKSGDTLFWSMVRDLIENNSTDQFSLTGLAKELLERKNNFPATKNEQQKAMARMIQALALIFFEHFCCHYYLKTQRLPISN